jgi:hypothetical protein
MQEHALHLKNVTMTDYADGGIVDGAQPRWIVHNSGCPPINSGKLVIPPVSERLMSMRHEDDEFEQELIKAMTEPIDPAASYSIGALCCPIIKPDVSALEELRNEMTKNNGISDNQAT